MKQSFSLLFLSFPFDLFPSHLRKGSRIAHTDLTIIKNSLPALLGQPPPGPFSVTPALVAGSNPNRFPYYAKSATLAVVAEYDSPPNVKMILLKDYQVLSGNLIARICQSKDIVIFGVDVEFPLRSTMKTIRPSYAEPHRHAPIRPGVNMRIRTPAYTWSQRLSGGPPHCWFTRSECNSLRGCQLCMHQSQNSIRIPG